VTREEIEELLGCPVPVRTGGGTVRAPGTLASHYAPNAQVLLVGLESLAAAARDAMQRGMRVGVLGEKLPADLPADITVLAQPADDAEFARELYRDLRAADALDLDIVLVVLPGDVGLGAAVADRLRRAAGRPTASAPGDV
jgi:L-threonylcarbamoyladenylate synthase